MDKVNHPPSHSFPPNSKNNPQETERKDRVQETGLRPQISKSPLSPNLEKKIEISSEIQKTEKVSKIVSKELSQNSEPNLSIIEEARKGIQKNLSTYLEENKSLFPTLNQATVQEIVRLCAQKNPMYTAYMFDHFALEDLLIKKQLIEETFKKMSSEQFNKFLIFCKNQKFSLSKGGFHEKEFRFKLAKICAERNLLESLNLETFFSYFEIEQKDRFEIAIVFLEKSPRLVFRNLNEFGIDVNNEQQLKNLGEACGKCSFWQAALILPGSHIFEILLETYSKQNIKAEKSIRLEFVEHLAQNDKKTVVERLNEFKLTTEEKRGLAQKWILEDPELIAKHFHLFDIKDPKEILKLAERWATKKSSSRECDFLNFGIKDPKQILALAKLYAEHNPINATKHIKQFGLQNESEIIEVLSICLKNDPWNVWFKLNKIGITNGEHLLSVACECLQKDPSYARNLLIALDPQESKMADNWEFKIKILELVLANPPDEWISTLKDGPEFSKFCDHFQIKTKEDQFTLLKSLFKGSDGSVVKNLSSFGVEKGSEQAVELAKALASGNGEICGQLIQEFGISNDKILFDICRLAIENTPEAIKYFKNFGPIAEKEKVQLAAVCIQKHPNQTEIILKELHIEEESERFEVAVLCAKKNIQSVGLHLDAFGLKNSDLILKLVDILFDIEPTSIFGIIISPSIMKNPLLLSSLFKRAAKNLPLELALLIERMGFDWMNMSEQEVFEILEMAVISSEGAALGPILKSDFPTNRILKLVSIAMTFDEGFFFESIKILVEANKMNCFPYNHLIEFVAKESSGAIEEAFKELESFLKHQKSPFDFSSIHNTVLFETKNVQEFRQTVRWLGCWLFGAHQNCGENELLWLSKEGFLEKMLRLKTPELRYPIGFALLEKQNEKFLEAYKKMESFKIPGIDDKILGVAVAKLFLVGVDSQSILSVAQYLKNKKCFNDERKVLIFLDILFLCAKTFPSKPEFIEKIFKKFNMKEGPAAAKKDLFALHSLLNFSGENLLLKNIDKANSINEILESALMEMNVLKQSEKIEEKLDKAFFKSRSAYSVVLYGLRLFKNKEPKVLECFECFVDFVLNDSFSQKRNSLEGNPHLQQVFSGKYEQLQEKWKKSIPETLFKGYTCLETEDPHDILLSGTEVSGSCLNIHRSPSTNKALLGFLMDGRTRLLAVKDKNGVIQSRAFLNILWDGTQPVLVLEGMYGKTTPPMHAEEIYEMAKKKAEQLGIPLLRSQLETGESLYGKDVQSLAGPAPYYYSDGLISEGMEMGLIKDGIYTLKKLVPIKN